MIPSVADRRTVIEAALEYAGGTHTLEDVERAVERGAMQFWPGPHSAIVTEIVQYPQKKIGNVFVLGAEPGYLHEIRTMYPILLDWAREQGCSQATFTGRRGWERTFVTGDGWRSSLRVYEKNL